MRATNSHLLACLVAVSLLGAGCSAVVDFDRGRIDPPIDDMNSVMTDDGLLVGWVGGVRAANTVVGWARLDGSEEAVDLEVIDEDGEVVGTGTANLARPDVVAAGFSDHEMVGYQIRAPGVPSGTELDVRLVGTTEVLPSGPVVVP